MKFHLPSTATEHPRSEQTRVARRQYRRLRRRDRALERVALDVRAGARVPGVDEHAGVTCPVCRAEPGHPCLSRRRRVRNRVHRRRENLSRATTPSCADCGACCLARVWGDGLARGALAPFVDVFESELHFYRPEELVERSDSSSTWRALRVERGRCFALVGEVPGALCGIYDRRPATCAGFEPGNYRCRVARARAGVGPQVRGA